MRQNRWKCFPQENEEWIRQQAKAEATREKHADRLNKLPTQITDDPCKAWSAKEKANLLKTLQQLNQLKSIEKILRHLVQSMWMRSRQYDEVKGRFDFLSSQREMSWLRKYASCLPSTTWMTRSWTRNQLWSHSRIFKVTSVKCLVGRFCWFDSDRARSSDSWCWNF